MARSKRLSDNPLIPTNDEPIAKSGKNTSDEYNPEEIRERTGNVPEPADKPALGRPRNENLVRDNPLQEGLTKEWIRASFIVRTEYLAKLKDISYTDRKTMKTIVDRAFALYIEEAEREHKEKGIEIIPWEPRSDS